MPISGLITQGLYGEGYADIFLHGLSGDATPVTPPITDDGVRCYLDSVKVESYTVNTDTWDDLTPYVLEQTGITIRQGISGGREIDLVASPSTLTFTLINAAGNFYDLFSTLDSLKVRVTLTFDGTPTVQFAGWIQSYKPNVEIHPSGDTVTITAMCWLAMAAQVPMLSPAIQRNITAGDAAQAVVDACPIAPDAVDFADGDTFVTCFDAVRGSTKAYGLLAQIATSNFSHLYTRRDGTVVLEAPDQRDSSVEVLKVPGLSADADLFGLEDGDILGTEGGDAIAFESPATLGALTDGYYKFDIQDGEYYANRVKVTAYPRRVSETPEVLASTPDPVLVPAGGSKTIKLDYIDPTGRARQVAAFTDEMETPHPGSVPDPTLSTLLTFESGDATDSTGNLTWTLGGGSVMIANTFHLNGYGNTDISGNICGRWAIGGGVSGDYITTPSSALLDPGSGAFTIDYWDCRVDVASGDAFAARNTTGAYPPWVVGLSDGDNLYAKFSFNGSSWGVELNLGPVNASTWTHYRICRDANGWFYAYAGRKGKPALIDKQYSASSIPAGSTTAGIFLWNTNVYTYGGADTFRFYKGKCLYDADIPETQPSIYLDQDYEGNTSDDFTGTDVTSDITVAPTYGTEAVEAVLANANAADAYVTFQQRGIGVFFDGTQESAAEYAAGIAFDGYKEWALTQKYQHSTAEGMAALQTILTNRQTKRTDLRGISFIGNRSKFLMRLALYGDIGSLIQIADTRTSVSGYYYIQERVLTIKNLIVDCKLRFCQDFTHV